MMTNLSTISDDEILRECKLRKSRKRRKEVERLLDMVAERTNDVEHYYVTGNEHGGYRSGSTTYIIFSISKVRTNDSI